MGRVEAKTQPTADRLGGQPMQPRPDASAVAGSMTGARSGPALTDQPAAVKQPAAATSEGTKSKSVTGRGAEVASREAPKELGRAPMQQRLQWHRFQTLCLCRACVKIQLPWARQIGMLLLMIVT